MKKTKLNKEEKLYTGRLIEVMETGTTIVIQNKKDGTITIAKGK